MQAWTSLETVESVHSWLEAGALFFFAALVVFDILAHLKPHNEKRLEKIGLICFAIAVIMEIVAYPYGRKYEHMASRTIAELNERASTNEKEAARLRKLAQDESLARLQLEAELAWRKISKDTQSATASHLVHFSGQIAQISYSAADLEAESFASDIASALRVAKWKVYDPQGIANMHQVLVTLKADDPLESGVTVTSARNPASRAAASALAHELSVLGFDATVSPATFPQASPGGVVSIFVKHRPHGVQGGFKLRDHKNPER